MSKLWFEQITVPRASAQADLIHYPYWAGPLRSRYPVVITVHDLIPLVLRDYRGSLLARAYSALAARCALRAHLLIADSEASKKDIVARLGVPTDRVRVIYLAADPRYSPNGPSVPDVSRKYGLEHPFIFYVGGLDRRKNVDGLISAFARARASLPGPCLLAIAGDSQRRGSLFPDLPSLTKSLGLEPYVRFLGVVPDEDIPQLYRSAAAVAFPSHYEGFGLPALEALACAAPLLCSSSSSLPEVVGDAAVSLDPSDSAAWTQAIVRIMTDQDLRERLRAAGPLQAGLFNWRRTAEETAGAYREVLEDRERRGRPCA